MPKLGQTPQYEQIDLPSYPKDDPAWVKIHTNPSVDDLLKTTFVTDPNERTRMLLSSLIVEWNFTDEDGEVAEINPTNVGRLSGDDFFLLTTKANKWLPPEYRIDTGVQPEESEQDKKKGSDGQSNAKGSKTSKRKSS